MANSGAHLAIDLGASSGRAMVGWFDPDSGHLRMEELHRFEHLACPSPTGPVWDLTGIWNHILQGLGNAGKWCEKHGRRLLSVGVDTWGVDWVLVGKGGELLGLSHCYRDPANIIASERVLKKVGGEFELYQQTGIQQMVINSLFQLVARKDQSPELFQGAERLLFIPDLFHYWLSGQLSCERTIASTSGLLSLESNGWNQSLIEQLELPQNIFGELTEPGTVLGDLLPAVAAHAGLESNVKVIAPGSHDTASAVAAVPFDASAKDSLSAYLSSGTWSLLGAELPQPFVSRSSCQAPFTNERGFDGTVRFLKNIGGLWLVQELRRQFIAEGQAVSFADMSEQARLADPFRTLINPNDPIFAAPGGMADRIRKFARESGQPEPETLGDLVRCCLDSLALCYLETIEQLESILGAKVTKLNIVGGGVQNQLLSEITCGVSGRQVVCGPVEATAIGNILGQARGLGVFSSLAEMRQSVADSFDVETLMPDEMPQGFLASEEILDRYRQVTQN